VQQVEKKMWLETYTVYNQWKKDWWAQYQRNGGVNFLTGFKQEGVFRRNQILCDPVQGSAFHCLLWSLIQIQKKLLWKKLKAKIVNQVYDSVLIDTPESELSDVAEIVKKFALEKVMKHWKWIIVPLAIEMEICPENWFSKQKLEVGV
jgi:hypothetical protein